MFLMFYLPFTFSKPFLQGSTCNKLHFINGEIDSESEEAEGPSLGPWQI